MTLPPYLKKYYQIFYLQSIKNFYNGPADVFIYNLFKHVPLISLNVHWDIFSKAQARKLLRMFLR